MQTTKDYRQKIANIVFATQQPTKRLQAQKNCCSTISQKNGTLQNSVLAIFAWHKVAPTKNSKCQLTSPLKCSGLLNDPSTPPRISVSTKNCHFCIAFSKMSLNFTTFQFGAKPKTPQPTSPELGGWAPTQEVVINPQEGGATTLPWGTYIVTMVTNHGKCRGMILQAIQAHQYNSQT